MLRLDKIGMSCGTFYTKVYNDKTWRISDVSSLANNDINNFLNMKLHTYIGFNFDFKPYN